MWLVLLISSDILFFKFLDSFSYIFILIVFYFYFIIFIGMLFKRVAIQLCMYLILKNKKIKENSKNVMKLIVNII